ILWEKATAKYEPNHEVSRCLCYDQRGNEPIDLSSSSSLRDLNISHGDMLYIVEKELEPEPE
ncbi:unnamed protein product, partial [Heterosigma akashiwo]